VYRPVSELIVAPELLCHSYLLYRAVTEVIAEAQWGPRKPRTCENRDRSVKDTVLQTNDWNIALVDSPVKHRDRSVKDTVNAGCLASLYIL
jgi:hypothetical protein